MDKNLVLTYSDYESGQDTLKIEELVSIHDLFAKSLLCPTEDEELTEELYTDVLKKAKRYAVEFRYPWFTEFTQAERNDKDDMRTSAHNAFITSLDILARWQGQNNIDTEWRDLLGDGGSHRKRIGDFACYLVFVEGINAR